MAEQNKPCEITWPLTLCLMLADIAQANGREAEATRYVRLAFEAIDRPPAQQA